MPWLNDEANSQSQNHTTVNVDVLRQQASSVGTKRDEVGGHVLDLLRRSHENSKHEDGETNTTSPVLVENRLAHVPQIPVRLAVLVCECVGAKDADHADHGLPEDDGDELRPQRVFWLACIASNIGVRADEGRKTANDSLNTEHVLPPQLRTVDGIWRAGI